MADRSPTLCLFFCFFLAADSICSNHISQQWAQSKFLQPVKIIGFRRERTHCCCRLVVFLSLMDILLARPPPAATPLPLPSSQQHAVSTEHTSEADTPTPPPRPRLSRRSSPCWPCSRRVESSCWRRRVSRRSRRRGGTPAAAARPWGRRAASPSRPCRWPGRGPAWSAPWRTAGKRRAWVWVCV